MNDFYWEIQHRQVELTGWCYFYTDLPTLMVNHSYMIFRPLRSNDKFAFIRHVIYKVVQR